MFAGPPERYKRARWASRSSLSRGRSSASSGRAIRSVRVMDMIADRIVRTREENWQAENEQGDPVNRTLAIGNRGGATLDNEENYCSAPP
jgi:hypothetical protein